MKPDVLSLYLSIAFLMFVLAVYAVGARMFFQWSWRKSLGMAVVLNIASFMVAEMVVRGILSFLPPTWYRLDNFVFHFARIFMAETAVMLVVRVTTEWAICRFATVPIGLVRTLAVVAAMNLVTALPSSISAYRMAHPTIAPPFSLASTFTATAPEIPLVFYSPRQRSLVRTTPGSTNQPFVSTALPASGYRISSDATRIVICNSSATVVFAHAPCPSGAVRETTIPLPFPRPMAAALSPDARWCATFDGSNAHVFSFPNGMATATVHVASLVSNSFLAWTTDSTQLVCGTAAALFSVDWRSGQAIPLTHMPDRMDINWFLDASCFMSTASFCHGATTVSVTRTAGITVASPSLNGTFSVAAAAQYAGIGFLPDASAFIFCLTCRSSEILALDLRTGIISHIAEGALCLIPGAGLRVPPPQ